MLRAAECLHQVCVADLPPLHQVCCWFAPSASGVLLICPLCIRCVADLPPLHHIRGLLRGAEELLRAAEERKMLRTADNVADLPPLHQVVPR